MQSESLKFSGGGAERVMSWVFAQIAVLGDRCEGIMPSLQTMAYLGRLGLGNSPASLVNAVMGMFAV